MQTRPTIETVKNCSYCSNTLKLFFMTAKTFSTAFASIFTIIFKEQVLWFQLQCVRAIINVMVFDNRSRNNTFTNLLLTIKNITRSHVRFTCSCNQKECKLLQINDHFKSKILLIEYEVKHYAGA